MTHVAYLKLIVAGAQEDVAGRLKPWFLPPLFLGARACQMLGAVGRERIKHYLSVRNVRCL